MKDCFHEGYKDVKDNLNASQMVKLIDEYESEQTFALSKDGSFEMITGNAVEKVRLWLHQKFCL